MKRGARRHWSTFNHLFQLSNSSSLSITGTVRVRRQLAGYWEGEREIEGWRGDMRGGRERDRGVERGYEEREREGRKGDMRGGREMNIQYSYTIA